ncbi:hypothetical protein NHQ30_005424 [Ciborinia camelliae]|nr:hypothetical protein NHQ30_005424 [Ciborinia camelliae]
MSNAITNTKKASEDRLEQLQNSLGECDSVHEDFKSAVEEMLAVMNTGRTFEYLLKSMEMLMKGFNDLGRFSGQKVQEFEDLVHLPRQNKQESGDLMHHTSQNMNKFKDLLHGSSQSVEEFEDRKDLSRTSSSKNLPEFEDPGDLPRPVQILVKASRWKETYGEEFRKKLDILRRNWESKAHDNIIEIKKKRVQKTRPHGGRNECEFDEMIILILINIGKQGFPQSKDYSDSSFRLPYPRDHPRPRVQI